MYSCNYMIILHKRNLHTVNCTIKNMTTNIMVNTSFSVANNISDVITLIHFWHIGIIRYLNFCKLKIVKYETVKIHLLFTFAFKTNFENLYWKNQLLEYRNEKFYNAAFFILSCAVLLHIYLRGIKLRV